MNDSQPCHCNSYFDYIDFSFIVWYMFVHYVCYFEHWLVKKKEAKYRNATAYYNLVVLFVWQEYCLRQGTVAYSA